MIEGPMGLAKFRPSTHQECNHHSDLACLASPLPATSHIQIDAQVSNPVEQVPDFYHNEDFEADDKPINPQTFLVRT